MEQRTDMIGMGLGNQGRQEAMNRSELLLQLLWGGFSYLVAAGNMLEGLSPFGVALAAACPQKLLLACTIGAAGGSLFPAGIAFSMKYAAGVMIVAVARMLLFGGKLLQYSSIYAPLIAGVSLFLPSLAVTMTSSFTAADILLCGAEALLAASAAWFFAHSVELFRQGVHVLRRTDAVCLFVTAAIFLLSLSAFHIFGLSLGQTAALLLILCSAATAGEGAGAVCGTICGTAISLAQFPNLSALGIYPLCGLLSGLFSHLGKFACAAAFSLTYALLTLLSRSPGDAISYLIESAAASTLFMLLPLNALQNLRQKAFRDLDRLESRGMKELLFSRIEDASAALSDIALSTKEISDKLAQLRCGTVEEVYQAAIDGVCRKCDRNVQCWQKDFNDSMNCFNHFTELLRKNAAITEDDFIYPLSAQCKKREKLLDIINSRYETFVEKEGLRRKAAQVRSVVTDQFEGMALMLEDLGGELLQLSSCDRKLSTKLQAYADTLALEIESISGCRDENDVLSVRLLLPEQKLPRIGKGEKLAEELSELCGCELDLPEIVCTKGKARLIFRELAAYYMDFANSQHICDMAKVCGDSCKTFTDRRSIAHMILSDGMGYGSAAALDSSMTVALLSRLIDANVSYDSALKIVNSALLVKSGEETLATIDIAAMDLHSGQVRFYKAGAAPTFIRRNGKTGYVDSTSLPVGILSSVEFEKSTLKLSAGDLIVMVSDGATTSGVDWIRHTIDRFDEADGLQSLCDDIRTTARLKRSDLRDDDITVMAGILRKR